MQNKFPGIGICLKDFDPYNFWGMYIKNNIELMKSAARKLDANPEEVLPITYDH